MLFLVVDDDTLSRELLKLLIEVERNEVETVVSGEAAVARIASCARSRPAAGEKIRSPLPHVVLVDVQMPGIAGDALAKALRAQLALGSEPDSGTTPASRTLLLAMSGTQPAPSELAGFDGFLLKPFTMAELNSMVERTMQRSVPFLETPLAAAPEQLAQPAAPPGEAGSAQHPGELTATLPDALDEDIYARMRDLMPIEQLGQMYALCVDDARRRIARLGTLAAQGDDLEFRKEAHAVKGGSGMIGACELYTLAAAAEQVGLTPSRPGAGTTGVTATLERLSLACDRLERILQERTRE